MSIVTMRRAVPVARMAGFNRLAVIAAVAISAALGAAQAQAAFPETPLEAAGYRVLPRNDKVISYLRALAAASRNTQIEIIGHSSRNLPIAAVYISKDAGFPSARTPSGEKLSVLLIGAQHGTEPAGGEALQRIARDIARGPMTHLLATTNFIIVPIANPDGRDNRRRTNAENVNLSTDFLVQSQPETRALTQLIRKIRPSVILDIHESAIYKRSSLGAQGFMTDVETQFEGSNNPNVADPLRHLALERLLPRIIARIATAGTRASRYIGEITDINQPITHGGLSLRNIRNYGGVLGPLSMLVETRLDPPGKYPTPRNIKVRVEKQYLAIGAFLSVVESHRREILKTVEQAAPGWRDPSRRNRVALVVEYAKDPRDPTITLPMNVIKKGTGKKIVIDRKVERQFEYRSRIIAKLTTPPPRAYAVTAYQPAIAALLTHHGIKFKTLSEGRTERAELQHVDVAKRDPIPYGKKGARMNIATTTTVRDVRLEAGDLWIDLTQPLGVLVPLMLDPRSSTSIYHDPGFSSHLLAGRDHYAVAIP